MLLRYCNHRCRSRRRAGFRKGCGRVDFYFAEVSWWGQRQEVCQLVSPLPVFAHVRNQVHLNHRQTWLCRASQLLLFPRVKVCGHLALSRSIESIFPTASPHFVSVSHFGNSHNISNFSLFFHYYDICHADL